MVIDACAELVTRIVKNGGDVDLPRPNSNDVKTSVKSWLGLGEWNEKEAPEEAGKDSVLVVFG